MEDKTNQNDELKKKNELLAQLGQKIKDDQIIINKLQKQLTAQDTIIKQLSDQKSPDKKADQPNDQQLAQVLSELERVKADLDAKKQEILQQKQEITTKTNQYDRLFAENTRLQNNIPAPYLAIPLVAGFALGGFLGYNLKPKKKKHRDMLDINSELI